MATPAERFRDDWPATEALRAMADQSAQGIAAEYGWNCDHACRLGALTGILRDMEQRNETPSEYVARVNGRD